MSQKTRSQLLDDIISLNEEIKRLQRGWRHAEELAQKYLLILEAKGIIVDDEQMGSTVAGISDVPQDGGRDSEEPDLVPQAVERQSDR